MTYTGVLNLFCTWAEFIILLTHVPQVHTEDSLLNLLLNWAFCLNWFTYSVIFFNRISY